MASAALGAPRRSVPATKDARAEETRGLGFLRVVLMMQVSTWATYPHCDIGLVRPTAVAVSHVAQC